MSIFIEKLSSLHQIKSAEITERDVLRVAGSLGRSGFGNPYDQSIDEVLRWIAGKNPSDLPKEAWDRKDFEVHLGGRNIFCRSDIIHKLDEETPVWTIKHEEPDSTVAGRVWKTEIVIANPQNRLPRFSLRLTITSKAFDQEFVPRSPRVVKQLIKKIGLRENKMPFTLEARFVDDDLSVDEFLDHLLDETRHVPIIAIAQNSKSNEYTFYPNHIPMDLAGLAHVYALSDQSTWKISDAIGRDRAVFNGGVKVYYSDFSKFSGLQTHRLISRSFLTEKFDNWRVADRLISKGIAENSVQRNRMGNEVLSYVDVSNLIKRQRIKAKKAANKDLSDSEQQSAYVKLLEEEVSELEKANAEAILLRDEAIEENQDYLERAQDAENRARILTAKVQSLIALLDQSGNSNQIEKAPKPSDWEEFINWVEREYSGQIILTKSAKSEIKKSVYSHIDTACEVIEWLATTGIKFRTDGVGQGMRDVNVVDGIIHAHCGSDAYDFSWQGNNYTADWHIKNGGNTRAPEHCLRIYFAWDEDAQQIIISHMPTHRKSSYS